MYKTSFIPINICLGTLDVQKHTYDMVKSLSSSKFNDSGSVLTSLSEKPTIFHENPFSRLELLFFFFAVTQ